MRVVNGTLTGAGGVYVATRSVAVTAVASAAAVTLAIVTLLAGRRPAARESGNLPSRSDGPVDPDT
jgi:hypothetical protein